ncbi:MAG: alkaline phosphatase [Muribaculaceae bacterium]|nr:alkaline phosphatase [Muribaculaceae bacterium]
MKLKTILASLALTSALTLWAESPKYIFYFIGDGMGMGPVMAAETYNRTVLGNDTPILMMQFPVAGACMTYSASSSVTDSAAAGTALSTGSKTRNSMLGMNPDTLAVYSMAEVLKDNGYAVGVVTSVAPDDATPGAFYAHVPKRSQYYDINRQFVTGKVDFLAGSSLRGWKDKEGRLTDIKDLYAGNNIAVLRGYDELTEAGNLLDYNKVVFLPDAPYSPYNIGYTVDSITDGITLQDMTEVCIDYLKKKSPEKFFIMVEGGNIDHALHANDGGAAIMEILNFQKSIEMAYKFMLEHPEETLIVVTADHDTGGMSVGNSTLRYAVNFDIFTNQKASKEMFSDYCKSLLENDDYTWEEMQKYLADTFGFWNTVTLSDEQTNALKDEFINTFELRKSEDKKSLYASFNSFADNVFRILNSQAGVGFTTGSHTGNPVPVYAAGKGAEIFSNMNNNIEIPAKILQMAGYQLYK